MKFAISFFLSIFSLFFLQNPVSADENFDISVKNKYSILENSSTTVSQNISIVNKKKFIYTPSYTVTFGFTDLKNIQVYNQFGSIPFNYDQNDDSVSLTINFLNPPKGIGATNSFTINFETYDLVEKKMEVYEVIIPGITEPETFTSYDSEIITPKDFPEAKIIKPKLPKDGRLTFTKGETGQGGIVLIFGNKQFYELNLKYNIENPNLFPIKTEIALPPNTNYQKSLIESLSIEPDDVEVDDDGNWLATYTLLPREKKIIDVKVFVILNSEPQKQPITNEERELYTRERAFWDVNDSEIKELSSKLKTPENIYNFVVKTLNYNYNKVAVDNARLGGGGALKNKNDSVCLEFADLFVTLSRAAGIPARTVEGYAYTKNSKLRPLSLVKDVLHAWAEYYDDKKGAWIMVDPTWGNTTHGADYFNSLDLNHIAFVIKGEESNYPIPAGGYKFSENTKDVSVSFSDATRNESKRSLDIDGSFPSFSLSGIPIAGSVSVRNSGNDFLSSKKILISNETTGDKKEYTVKNLPPFGTDNFKVSFNTPFLTNSTHVIKIRTDDKEKTEKIKVSFFIPNTSFFMLGGGILVATALITWASYKTWRIYIQRQKR